MKTPKSLKTKLLRIIRANFDIYIVDKKFVCHPKGCLVPVPISEFKAFTAIAKMIEQIYPCGKFYSIMRHCRRFKCHKLLV